MKFIELAKTLLLSLSFFSLSIGAVEQKSNLDSLMPSYVDVRHTDDLNKLKEMKIVRALVVPSRTDFYIRNGKISGLVVRLLDNYEKSLNKGVKREDEKIRIVYVPVDFDQLIPGLLDGRGDIAASLLTVTDERKKLVDFASGHTNRVKELVVISSNSDINLSSVDDLAGKEVYVLKGSSYVEHLEQLNQTIPNNPIKIIEAQEHLASEDILEILNAGIIEITVVDGFKANLWAKVLPNIKVRDDLIINEAGSIGWAVRKNNPELKKDLDIFMNKVKKGTLLGNILFNQYYGRDQKLENLKSSEEREKFSQHIDLFKKYGDQYDLNHYKLIAQAYQESRLNQQLVSPRGAIGVMQVLPSTAADKNVAVAGIDSLENNIHAGAKYMNFIRMRYFDSPDISPEDQIFFSWAAYNAGPANVKKMRKLADEMGLNKNVWFKNVEIAAGRIIGTETVRYVANIHKYYSTYLLLEQKESREYNTN
ncbi:MAG: lytic transglycosylase F [Methylophaga sp.]|nr:lytic transglycosylase F [Methylophaga sp.]